MKRLYILLIISLSLTLVSSSLSAHDFALITRPSMTHPHGCVNISIMYGHSIPMDDFLPAKRIATYSLYDPLLGKLDLPFNTDANNDITYANKGIKKDGFESATLQTGENFLQRIIFTEQTIPGVYQATGSLKKTFLTTWDDEKGRRHWTPKSMDEVTKSKKVKDIKMSILYQSFAKSFVTKGDWVQPEPVGHDLELIPLTDLSNVHAGDFITFKILLNGKPYTPKNIPPAKLTAYGENYGMQESPDFYYGIWSNIVDGTAKIRVTDPGIWLVKLFVKQPIKDTPSNKELRKKVTEVAYIATASFYVAE
jgi:uncharacterized GH25 family protein